MVPPSRESVSPPWVSSGQISSSRVRLALAQISARGVPVVGTDYVSDIVPVIMAGIIGIYGLVVSVLISDGLKQSLPLYTGFIQLGAGLSVGLAGLAAGYVVCSQVSNFASCIPHVPRGRFIQYMQQSRTDIV